MDVQVNGQVEHEITSRDAASRLGLADSNYGSYTP